MMTLIADPCCDGLERDATLDRISELVAALATELDRYAILKARTDEHLTRLVHAEIKRLAEGTVAASTVLTCDTVSG